MILCFRICDILIFNGANYGYFVVTDPLSGGSAVILGYSAYKLNNSYYPGYETQHGIFADYLNSHFLRFNALERDDAGGIATGSYRNVMIMDNVGRVGINLGNSEPVQHPTASLHVNGTVRFANLPSGSGAVLVTDADGNVFKSTVASGRPANDDNALTDNVTALKKEVSNLRNQVEQLLKIVNQKSSLTLERSTKGFFIYPNPANDVIKISTLNESSTGSKKVIFQTIAGKTLPSFSMDNNSLSIPVKNVAAGVYIVNIYQNNSYCNQRKL